MGNVPSQLPVTEAAGFDKANGASSQSVPAPAASTTDNFNAETLAYAERNNLKPYLQPLLDATQRIFPKAQWVKVYVKQDPEVAGDAVIIYDVRVSDLRY